MKKLFLLLFLLLTSTFIISCNSEDRKNIKVSTSFIQDVSETETIMSIQQKKMVLLVDPKLGFKNGTYWFEISFLEKIKPNTGIVFNLSESTIEKIELFDNKGPLNYSNLEKTHPALGFLHEGKQDYYLKIKFGKQAHFPLTVRRLADHYSSERITFFKNGLYYGFALMVLIINLFFYFSLKSKTFLFYSFFLMAINLSFLDIDGLFYLFLPHSIIYYIGILFRFSIPFFGAFFAHRFLNLREFMPRSKKLGAIFLLLSFLSYLGFLLTNYYLYAAIGDTFGLITLLYYWILGALVYKKHDFAKIFTIGYSLVLLSAVWYISQLNWGIQDFFSVGPNLLKFGALFEMLILTYAITYRVKSLQVENDEFKKEIKSYVGEIVFLEEKIKNSTRSSTEDKISVLSEKYNLTTQEVNVLQLISTGYSNQRIADELFISLNTLKYHIRNIYQKLDIKSKGQAISIVSSQNIVP